MRIESAVFAPAAYAPYPDAGWRARCTLRRIEAAMMSRTDATRRTTRRSSLPIVIGPVVLGVCWIALGVVAGAQHAACWGGFDLASIAGPLALNYRLDPDLGPALPLFGYAAQCISAYLLLFLCGLVAMGRRSKTIFVAISAFGTVIVSLYFCGAYLAAFPALLDGGMFCDLGFELIPYGGLILAAVVAVVGTVVGWLIDRRAMADGR
jgi:hypothetical protein